MSSSNQNSDDQEMNLDSLMDDTINELTGTDYPIDDIETLHGETPVVIVNSLEIYLKVEDPDNPHEFKIGNDGEPVRGKRICGAIRAGGDRSFRCRMPAGHSTNHPGYGQCSIHEHLYKGRYSSLRILQEYKKEGMALDLHELVAANNDILNDPKLGEIIDEIVIMERMIAKMLNNKEMDNPAGYKFIAGRIDTLVNAKKTKAKMEVDRLLLDVNSIKLFVRGLFNILRRELPATYYSKVAKAFEDELVFPINRSMQDMIKVDIDKSDPEETNQIGYSNLH